MPRALVGLRGATKNMENREQGTENGGRINGFAVPFAGSEFPVLGSRFPSASSFVPALPRWGTHLRPRAFLAKVAAEWDCRFSPAGALRDAARRRRLLPMNRTVEVPLLAKEGSGEVWNAAVLNHPLAPSLVRRGFIGPIHPARRVGALRASGSVVVFKRQLPLTLRDPTGEEAGLERP